MSDLNKRSLFNRPKNHKCPRSFYISRSQKNATVYASIKKKGDYNVCYYLKQVRTVSGEAKYQHVSRRTLILVTTQYI